MGVNIQTIKEIRFYLAAELKEVYQEPEIRSITNIVIKTVFGINKLQQLQASTNILSEEQKEKIQKICLELKSGKPLQYVLGETEFYDCIIRLNSSVLIPRPETEELVDLIIKENPGFTGTILDIGTGSGCIAIALAANLPFSAVCGIDISEEALSLARENAALNNVAVRFERNDILNFNFEKAPETGIIVSNPPYVTKSEKQFMNRNVLEFEPHTALFVEDSDPLIFYEYILRAAGKILLPGGKIYFEINEAKGQSVKELVEASGFLDVHIVSDINGKDRIIKGIKHV